MLLHKGRHQQCNINVVFSLSVACFNSVFSLVILLFGYPEKKIYTNFQSKNEGRALDTSARYT